jgi:hypothetical protein
MRRRRKYLDIIESSCEAVLRQVDSLFSQSRRCHRHGRAIGASLKRACLEASWDSFDAFEDASLLMIYTSRMELPASAMTTSW